MYHVLLYTDNMEITQGDEIDITVLPAGDRDNK
jgi:hypothetical protein